MTTDKPSEAERLADAIDPLTRPRLLDNLTLGVAAAELRRLSAVEDEWMAMSQDDGKRDREIERLLEKNKALRADAEAYRLLRLGRHWSVIDGIGDALKGEELDAAIAAQQEPRK